MSEFEIRASFNKFDIDKNGTMGELRQLLMVRSVTAASPPPICQFMCVSSCHITCSYLLVGTKPTMSIQHLNSVCFDIGVRF